MAEIGGSPSAPHQPFFQPGPAEKGEPDMESQRPSHVSVPAGEQVSTPTTPPHPGRALTPRV
jgi:hypothetical protein